MFLFPFVWWRKPAVAWNQGVGQDCDHPLPGGVDDAASHYSGGIAAQAHGHGEALLAAGLAALEGTVHVKGHPGQIA